MAEHTVQERREVSAPTQHKIIFSVRKSEGVYVTQTVHGQWAVGVTSFEDAARMLARKLYPYSAWELTCVDSADRTVEVFELGLMA